MKMPSKNQVSFLVCLLSVFFGSCIRTRNANAKLKVDLEAPVKWKPSDVSFLIPLPESRSQLLQTPGLVEILKVHESSGLGLSESLIKSQLSGSVLSAYRRSSSEAFQHSPKRSKELLEVFSRLETWKIVGIAWGPKFDRYKASLRLVLQPVFQSIEFVRTPFNSRPLGSGPTPFEHYRQKSMPFGLNAWADQSWYPQYDSQSDLLSSYTTEDASLHMIFHLEKETFSGLKDLMSKLARIEQGLLSEPETESDFGSAMEFGPKRALQTQEGLSLLRSVLNLSKKSKTGKLLLSTAGVHDGGQDWTYSGVSMPGLIPIQISEKHGGQAEETQFQVATSIVSRFPVLLRHSSDERSLGSFFGLSSMKEKKNNWMPLKQTLHEILNFKNQPSKTGVLREKFTNKSGTVLSLAIAEEINNSKSEVVSKVERFFDPNEVRLDEPLCVSCHFSTTIARQIAATEFVEANHSCKKEGCLDFGKIGYDESSTQAHYEQLKYPLFYSFVGRNLGYYLDVPAVGVPARNLAREVAKTPQLNLS